MNVIWDGEDRPKLTPWQELKRRVRYRFAEACEAIERVLFGGM